MRNPFIAIAAFFYNLKAYFGYAVPTPDLIAYKVANKILAESGHSFPTEVVVHVSDEAWEKRYKGQKRDARVVQGLVEERLKKVSGTNVALSVTIEGPKDPYAQKRSPSMDIELKWTDGPSLKTKPEGNGTGKIFDPTRIHMGEGPTEKGPHQSDDSSKDKTQIPIQTPAGDKTQVMTERHHAVTSTAWVAAPNGKCYRIHDGSTIGALRGTDKVADVALANDERLKYVSRLQGRFHFDAASSTWSIECIGKRTMAILGTDESIKLRHSGDPALPLCDLDRIKLDANEDYMVRFSTSKEDLAGLADATERPRKPLQR